MRHCHISILCNELSFLKHKLKFLYDNFDQLIFIDYDILNNCNSKDGSLEFIESFDDKDNKITLIKFTEKDLKIINDFNGVSMIEKRKMFSKGSGFIKDDIDIVWATDMDEFFNKNLIKITENKFSNDKDLITLNIPHYIFTYNSFNIFKGTEINNSSYICPPRITRHFKGKIYGHCNFDSYGKTLKCSEEFIYHYAYVGYKRNVSKLRIYTKDNNPEKIRINKKYLDIYSESLKRNDKYIDIFHPNLKLNMSSIKFNSPHPDYINIEKMINDLNS
jgi:hypothetical protein